MGTPKDFVSVSTFERRRGARAHVTAPKRFFDVTSRSINVANVRPIPKAHTTLCVKGGGNQTVAIATVARFPFWLLLFSAAAATAADVKGIIKPQLFQREQWRIVIASFFFLQEKG